ncbi:methylated-DNA--[protein]-cysteine S-methyltransferase [uncultured Campylobacter sp.]|uniref:methylated-DNA--[protein]-cysteine S-methyltransferase n=1 Tax=uncultured Campylobacter sp. TaxID=218934 RepID=UPI0026127FC2|nr:methylated-DNA--[protein]-cysteine S-methyltransferase [uncultured Campylobacter sp.]
MRGKTSRHQSFGARRERKILHERAKRAKRILRGKNLAVFDQTRRWLDLYFSGREPGFTPALNPLGSAFRRAVWEILLKIPYGNTTTYGQIAREIAAARGLAKMSAQAVGGVVGHNEISIIIPCHRVVGTCGSLTGYAGGIDRKIKLLQPGGVDMRGLFTPLQIAPRRKNAVARPRPKKLAG